MTELHCSVTLCSADKNPVLQFVPARPDTPPPRSHSSFPGMDSWLDENGPMTLPAQSTKEQSCLFVMITDPPAALQLSRTRLGPNCGGQSGSTRPSLCSVVLLSCSPLPGVPNDDCSDCRDCADLTAKALGCMGLLTGAGRNNPAVRMMPLCPAGGERCRGHHVVPRHVQLNTAKISLHPDVDQKETASAPIADPELPGLYRPPALLAFFYRLCLFRPSLVGALHSAGRHSLTSEQSRRRNNWRCSDVRTMPIMSRARRCIEIRGLGT